MPCLAETKTDPSFIFPSRTDRTSQVVIFKILAYTVKCYLCSLTLLILWVSAGGLVSCTRGECQGSVCSLLVWVRVRQWYGHPWAPLCPFPLSPWHPSLQAAITSPQKHCQLPTGILAPSCSLLSCSSPAPLGGPKDRHPRGYQCC